MKLQKISIGRIILINFILMFIVESINEGNGFSWLAELSSILEFFIYSLITSSISFLIYLGLRKFGEKKAVLISSLIGVPVLIITFIVIVYLFYKQ